MSALSKFHSTRLSIQELLSGRIRLQRYGLFLKLKHLYPNKMQINFILTTRVQKTDNICNSSFSSSEVKGVIAPYGR